MKKLVTHSGSFHADDVYAVAALQLYFGADALDIVRTRDRAIIDAADIVVDVGGIHDASTLRFDHHQNGAPVRENGIPFAAFGLVWQMYGGELCGDEKIASWIDETLVQAVDAGDVGVTLYDLREANQMPYELYQVIGSFRPAWGDTKPKDEAFFEAVAFARSHLGRIIDQHRGSAKMSLHMKALYEAATDKRVLVSDIAISASAAIDHPEPLFVVSPDGDGDNANWVANAVALELGRFGNRRDFPAAWAGLTGVTLREVTGISDAVFCHKNRFCFVAGSKAGALAAVEQALATE
jgi:uncharacterized UPF0160 family protein